jgi:hypothetical protein
LKRIEFKTSRPKLGNILDCLGAIEGSIRLEIGIFGVIEDKRQPRQGASGKNGRTGRKSAGKRASFLQNRHKFAGFDVASSGMSCLSPFLGGGIIKNGGIFDKSRRFLSN